MRTRAARGRRGFEPSCGAQRAPNRREELARKHPEEVARLQLAIDDEYLAERVVHLSPINGQRPNLDRVLDIESYHDNVIDGCRCICHQIQNANVRIGYLARGCFNKSERSRPHGTSEELVDFGSVRALP